MALDGAGDCVLFACFMSFNGNEGYIIIELGSYGDID